MTSELVSDASVTEGENITYTATLDEIPRMARVTAEDAKQWCNDHYRRWRLQEPRRFQVASDDVYVGGDTARDYH
ncbi:hypothetical protein OK016_00035 [Vibrio chagasii]|nr:hypothetical protein [Vibrio chagasii]